ncbi:MAG: hypothetical protein WCJ45_02305 [bacterium]
MDSISLYTLEGLKEGGQEIREQEIREQEPGNSKQGINIYHGDDEEIMEEFLILKAMVEDA